MSWWPLGEPPVNCPVVGIPNSGIEYTVKGYILWPRGIEAGEIDRI